MCLIVNLILYLFMKIIGIDLHLVPEADHHINHKAFGYSITIMPLKFCELILTSNMKFHLKSFRGFFVLLLLELKEFFFKSKLFS